MEIWTPSSADINPMDIIIRPILESGVSRISFSSMSDLKETLMPSEYNLVEGVVKPWRISVEKGLRFR